ncbi:Asp/Glu/hydantoin racemase [Segniliparus rotundus DSM 44985]|uniref:Hydantoin racemase n=1 Tax=Segniliparus rotundus (strain ATCC BAA-972 / CDC 1076 / CIP 108378 / DSM 44985 / JCM 13578) TaxID=640132 RepID=D6Z7S1_SEGRD|nr:aspartate/glutamate racemase family protein [Segniliparus rotundus]ADG98001.1 Asp/Glu/hydantoin racemase [Segniliparus rotundus DSM 44985]
MTTHIVVMNCNTSEPMTEAIGAHARAAAREGTRISALRPSWGPESAEGNYDSFVTAAAVLDRLHTLDFPFDALVMAGFGEHGREGARELLDVPVIDITEAAAQFAMLLGRSYGVVTTLSRAVGQIEDSLRLAGLFERCAGVVAAELGVLELEEDSAAAAVVAASRAVLDRGAEVLVLGCAGMTRLASALAQQVDVPVVDGVAAAVKLAESLVDLGLTTSKHGSYARPREKRRPGWPISPTPGGQPRQR